MLSKCANPSCETKLQYLREGKLLRVERGTDGPFLTNSPKPVRTVEHFWLCGPCSDYLTMRFDAASGVHVEAKTAAAPLIKRAAAS